MSDYDYNREGSSQCEAVRDDLAELALGILSGRRRSEVLTHVEACSRCSAELGRLSIVADNLVQLAPEVEPPLGFELRLAERLRAVGATRRPRRLRRVGVLAVGVVAMITLGLGVGHLATPRVTAHYPVGSVDLNSAELTSHGRMLGEAFVSTGSPEWVFMTISVGDWSGIVKCEVTLAGGKVETVGVIKIWKGKAAWGAQLASSASKVRVARLVALDGAVLASAKLPS